MKLGYLLIIFLVTSLYSYPQVLGYTVNYEVIGKTIFGIPTVCSVPFSDPDLFDTEVKMLFFQARSSVYEWNTQLQSADRFNRANWKINYLQLKSESDYSSCDVIIKFEPKPKDPSLHYVALGEAQIPEDPSDPIVVIIYYQNIGMCQTQDQYYIYYNPCYQRGTFTDRSIGNTIRHELGHAFGLGHYVSDDMQVNKAWASGGRPAPSIMIITEHQNPYEIMILPVDVEKLRSIYGEVGFAGNKRETTQDVGSNEMAFQNNIPSWIRNNAKWWSDKQISDKDFASGIEYLIQNKIIVMPETAIQKEISDQKIPNWVRQNAAWWSDGLISDDEFIKGLQYMIQHGIIRV